MLVFEMAHFLKALLVVTSAMVILNVLAYNEIQWDSSNIGAPVGSQVTVTCEVNALSSRDEVYISKYVDRYTLIPIAKRHDIINPAMEQLYEASKKSRYDSSSSPRIRFTIKKLTDETAGKYICNATGAYRPSARITIAIIYPHCPNPRTELVCRKNNYCLAASRVCDGQSDCPDGEDETNCFNGAVDPYKLCEFPNCACDRKKRGATCNLVSLGQANFPDDLFTLDLNQAPLQTIPVGAFENLSNLKGLSIMNTSISTIIAGNFRGLDSLARLIIESTPITTIRTGGLVGMPLLKYLKLAYTKLTTLNSGTFQGIENVRAIEIITSDLSSITRDTFDKLTLLTKIHISNCHLGVLPDKLFINNPILKMVELVKAGITAFGDNTFYGLKRVKSIDISDNNANIKQEFLNHLAKSAEKVIMRSMGRDTTFYIGTFQKFYKFEILDLSNSRMFTLPSPGTYLDCIDGSCYQKCGKFEYFNRPLRELKTMSDPVVYAFHYDLYKLEEDFFGPDASAVKSVTIHADTVYTHLDVGLKKPVRIITRNFWVKEGQIFPSYGSGFGCRFEYVKTLHGERNLVYIQIGLFQVFTQNVQFKKFCGHQEGLAQSLVRFTGLLPDYNTLQATVQCAQMIGDSVEEITKHSLPMLKSVIAFASSPGTATIPRFNVVLNEALMIQQIFDVKLRHEAKLIPYLSLSTYDTILTGLQTHANDYKKALDDIAANLERISGQKYKFTALNQAASNTLQIATREKQDNEQALEVSKRALERLRAKYQEMRTEMIEKQETFQRELRKWARRAAIKSALGIVTGIGGIFVGVRSNDKGAILENTGSLAGSLMDLYDLVNAVSEITEVCQDMLKIVEENGATINAKDVSQYLEDLEAAADLQGALPEWQNMVDIVEINVNSPELREISGHADFHEAILKVANVGRALTKELMRQSRLLIESYSKSLREQLAVEFNNLVASEVNGITSSYDDTYQLEWGLKGQAFQVRMLLIEHLFEYCSAKFYFQFTDCADDVQPFVDDSLGALIGKIAKAKVNQITNMVNIAGSSDFKETVVLKDETICRTITDCPIKTLQRGFYAVVRVAKTMANFADYQRVRVKDVTVLLKGATRNGRDISIHIGTVGAFTDYWDNQQYKFISVPFNRLFKYEPSSDGQSIAGVSITANDINQNLFISTSPFTDWVLQVDPRDNSGINLSGISEIVIEFKGVANQD
ncbi:uncharacterized protein LOC135494719 [Lineus longissimus]|uniref:uncharacterized protein LOC135494719 n=1 Tax=Lineus longissimus TaxID=88925 RepID=UPI002B4DA38A